MRTLLRQLRRSPARAAVTVLALALAIGAIGVFAIPTVSTASLRDAAERDRLGDVMTEITEVADAPATTARLEAVDGVAAADLFVVGRTELPGGRVRVVGAPQDQDTDVVHVTEGRAASAPGEVVVSEGVAEVGTVAASPAGPLTVVGVGTTLWWSESDALFTDAATARVLTGASGPNWMSLVAVDDGADELRRIATDARAVLEADGGTYTEFPRFLPDGRTPIEDDIDQVSTLIGMLGVVAGVVALVLLASTTNTLITERTREVAVMRALGARSRPLRRRLRRIAVGLALAAVVIGVPLGVVLSNLIARMVLQEFVGLTPDVAVSLPVVVASTAFALVGARVVSARAARRVTGQPLAESLRDRDATPFGRRRTERAVAAIPVLGTRTRLALRAAVHRPARTLAIAAQVGAAVAAVVIITTLTTSVNDFNSATREPWTWDTITRASTGLPFDADLVDGPEGRAVAAETGVWVGGELDGDEIDVFGVAPDTEQFVGEVVDGRWVRDGDEIVLSAGYVDRTGVELGDEVVVELAGGPFTATVVGAVDDHARAAYGDRDAIATASGAPGMANVVWSTGGVPDVDWPVAVSTSTAAELDEDDEAARSAIVTIFGAIAVIVAGVAALSVVSTLAVDLHERRHELAAMRAIGARRRRLRSTVAVELLGVGAVGVGLGLVAGWFGAVGIIASFEASNAVDIGTTFASGAVAPLVVGTTVALIALAALAVRGASRRPVAEVLRGSA